MDKFEYLQTLWDRLYKEGKITEEEYDIFTQAVRELKEESTTKETK